MRETKAYSLAFKPGSIENIFKLRLCHPFRKVQWCVAADLESESFRTGFRSEQYYLEEPEQGVLHVLEQASRGYELLP